MEADRWFSALPFLRFPSDWEVKIIPPMVGAVIRFRVRRGGAEVSVYFDGYNALGYMGQPYWEVYPCTGEDVARFVLGEEAEMLAEIERTLAKGKGR